MEVDPPFFQGLPFESDGAGDGVSPGEPRVVAAAEDRDQAHTGEQRGGKLAALFEDAHGSRLLSGEVAIKGEPTPSPTVPSAPGRPVRLAMRARIFAPGKPPGRRKVSTQRAS